MPIEVWIDAFLSCYVRRSDFYSMREWPNGLGYADQENAVVQMLNVIEDSFNKVISKKIEAEARKNGKQNRV